MVLRSIQKIGPWVASVVLACSLGAGAAWAAGGPRQMVRAVAEDPDNARVIVKYRSGSSLAVAAAGQPKHAARLGRQLTLAMQDGHVLGQRTQSLRASGLSSSQLATRLAALPEVEWAVAVRRKTITAVEPNDPYFGGGQTSVTPAVGQWYLRAPDATVLSAVNAVGAWAITTGSPAMTVAVLDTGVVKSHPDLAGKLHAGYDFVSRSSQSADGDGRDADASDPGDWSTASDSCGEQPSSWHGTQVAGLIGAATDNGIGMAGLGRNVRVLPVRVLGQCGGYDDDIIAAMRWASGVSAVPVANAHPARVLNLSLGSSGTCSAAYREAIAEVNAAGVVVVVAAGNDTGHAVNEPANCPGAIAVAGVRHAGTKVGYSNIGPEVAIAAPAGNCVNDTGACLYPLLTTLNASKTSPGAHIYSDSFDPSLGTSFAAPMVAGTVALMLSVDASMTPAQVKSALQAVARTFPTTGAQDTAAVACRAPTSVDQIECYCNTSTCGAGMLDAGAAVALALDRTLAPVAAVGVSNATPTEGAVITLDGAGSTASAGRTITAYQWTILSGADLASWVGATDGASASLATRAAGVVVVQLTVTDSAQAQHSRTASITVAALPVVVTPPAAGTGGGGGGALGWSWVAGLALAVLALSRRR
jgi:serine protease